MTRFKQVLAKNRKSFGMIWVFEYASQSRMAAATAMTAVQQLSSITGFDETLLNKLHVILVAFSCNHYINSEKFRIFCEKKFENAKEFFVCIYKH